MIEQSTHLQEELHWLGEMVKKGKSRDWWIGLLRHYYDPAKEWHICEREVAVVRQYVADVVRFWRHA
jgi:hypothetical protein